MQKESNILHTESRSSYMRYFGIKGRCIVTGALLGNLHDAWLLVRRVSYNFDSMIASHNLQPYSLHFELR